MVAIENIDIGGNLSKIRNACCAIATKYSLGNKLGRVDN